MRDRQFIIGEIQRTAALNGNEPVGQTKFRTETGIAPHEWARYWPRWGDALTEAGFVPLAWNQASDEENTLNELAKLVRKYQRYPVKNEIVIEKRGGAQVPAPSVLFRRFGTRSKIIQKLQDHCSADEAFEDVSALLAQETLDPDSEEDVSEGNFRAGKIKPSGHVYLVKSGRRYKIGQTANRWQRMNQLDKQTSEGLDEVVHTIAAIDDAPGIEKYWHERFKEKRQHGEWFDLSTEDISAFKKRKFM